MPKDNTLVIGLVSAIALLLVGWGLYFLIFGGSPSAEELVAIALDTNLDEETRIEASRELLNCDQADYALLKRLLDESDLDEVRTGALLAIGKHRYWEAVPMLLTLVEGDNPFLAEKAVYAIQLILPTRCRSFSGSDPLEKRQETVEKIKEELPFAYVAFCFEKTAKKLGKNEADVTQEEVDAEFPPQDIPENMRFSE